MKKLAVGSGQLASEDKRVGSGEDRALLCRDD